MTSAPLVSFDDEPLVLVNEADEEVGFATKRRCHDGDGLLHRAFSVFLFSPAGDVLLQQRSEQKRLWPGVWSNACCSHQRRGETQEAAVQRRLLEELSLEAEVRFFFKFSYHARYDLHGSERELCHVYAGRLTGWPAVNANASPSITACAKTAMSAAPVQPSRLATQASVGRSAHETSATSTAATTSDQA